MLERSLAVRSISTPFAIIAAPEIGGRADLAAISVVITGLIGMLLGEWLLGWLPVGTATALRRNPEEGVIASLTMIIAGVLMVLLAPHMGEWL
jgi:putative effector of murein hydrolase